MAISIVDLFEQVDIEYDDTVGMSIAFGILMDGNAFLIKGTPVVKFRQNIDGSQVFGFDALCVQLLCAGEDFLLQSLCQLTQFLLVLFTLAVLYFQSFLRFFTLRYVPPYSDESLERVSLHIIARHLEDLIVMNVVIGISRPFFRLADRTFGHSLTVTLHTGVCKFLGKQLVFSLADIVVPVYTVKVQDDGVAIDPAELFVFHKDRVGYGVEQALELHDQRFKLFILFLQGFMILTGHTNSLKCIICPF